MKSKTTLVTAIILAATLAIGFFVGCQSDSEYAYDFRNYVPSYTPQQAHTLQPTETTKTQEDTAIKQEIAELQDKIEQLEKKENQAHGQLAEGKTGSPPDTIMNELNTEFRIEQPALTGSIGTELDGIADNRTLPPELEYISADEVWVIVKPSGQPAPNEEQPGCGAMMVDVDEYKKNIPLPLKHTDVKGHIYGYIASVDVTQQFHNPFDVKIEAVYVFPLPQNAAVDEFIMTIGNRKIRGIIRERAEAEKIYAQARAQGYTASLLTQERPNIFTQKVANIEPRKDIDVTIHYFNTLAYVDGWYEFVFPMVVGPRYNPPYTTDGVGAVAAGQGGTSGQRTEVQYLNPNQRSGHDISLSVDIDAGTVIEALDCPSHVIAADFPDDQQAAVAISPNDSIPNKDFVLRYKVAGDNVKSALVTHSDGRDNYFTMMLYPPQDLSRLQRAPMEMIFVLDCSGSMSGYPIETAKSAIKRALKKLQPNDTFQVIRFSNNASQLGPQPILATPENIRRGIDYVDKLNGSGGTQMIKGIKAALNFQHDPQRLRLVSFMTDGYIGNEAQILAAVHKKLGDARIFSFGIGNSVNRYLLDRMAKLGKGAVAYIGLNDNPAVAVDLFYDRISHPALTDIKIDWGHMEVSDVFPSTIPDLFVGRPVILTGKYTGFADAGIHVYGTVAGRPRRFTIPADTYNEATGHEGVAAIWARKKIEQLGAYQITTGDTDYAAAIKNTALRYGLMSSYTAFVAVDSTHKTDGDFGVTVAVPVPTPDGVRYDTTVQDQNLN